MKDSLVKLTSCGATYDSPWYNKLVNSGWSSAASSSWQKEPITNTPSLWGVRQSEATSAGTILNHNERKLTNEQYTTDNTRDGVESIPYHLGVGGIGHYSLLPESN